MSLSTCEVTFMSFNRSDAELLGKGLAGLTIVGTTIGGYSRVSAMTLGATVPVVFGSMLGILLLTPATNYLSNRINGSYVVQRKYCHFALQAASWTLGSLIGLAVTSVFFSIAANPFTLPALIAGGVSAAVMLALYAITREQTRTYDRLGHRVNSYLGTQASEMIPKGRQIIRDSVRLCAGSSAAVYDEAGVGISGQRSRAINQEPTTPTRSF